jgi:precorrin-2 dehydrogenase/sirohydrochlorin ferrochelatase
MQNNLYPVFLKLEKLKILLVGAGKVGGEKLHSILNNSPETHVKVVANAISDDVGRLAVNHWNVRLVQRKFQLNDLNNVDMIFLATNNHILHESIVKNANTRKILVNVADTPDLCDFYLGSIVQKGYLKIGISTNGKSPTIAKRFKQYLNVLIPDDINQLIININEIRNHLKVDFQEKVKILNEYTKSLLLKKHNEYYHKK